MNFDDLIINAGPPTVAIALQVWRFPNERSIEAAAEDLKKLAGKDISKEAADTIRSQGAVSGLAPSFITVTSGIFNLFVPFRHGAAYVYVTVCIILFIFLFVASQALAYSPVELVESRYSIQIISKRVIRLPIGPYRLIDVGIYSVNIFLIIISFVVWAHQNNILANKQHSRVQPLAELKQSGNIACKCVVEISNLSTDAVNQRLNLTVKTSCTSN
jgi:hypothetical protein